VTTRTCSTLRRQKAEAAAEAFSSEPLEDATSRETWELLASAMGEGATLVDMIWHGAPRVYDPAVQAQVRARIRLRRRLGLPHSDCGHGKEGCDCLRTVLDAGEELTRTEALQAARAEHRAKWPRFRPLPRPPKRERQTPKRKPVPKPPAKKLTETPTRREPAEYRYGAPWISQRGRDQRSAFHDFIDQKF
jgi:hypothetical protein